MSAITRMNYGFGLRQERVEDDGNVLRISGIASNWDLDRQGDRVSAKALDDALHRYLTTNPILLYMHRYNMPMGRVTRAEVGVDGLYVERELPRPEPGTEAANVWRLVKAGVVRAFSIGGKWTREFVGGVKTIVRVDDLREISIAPVGVNASTLFSVQAGKAFGDPSDRLTRLREERALLGSLKRQRDLLDLRAEMLSAGLRTGRR